MYNPSMDPAFNLITRCAFDAPASAVWRETVDVIAYPEWWPAVKSVTIHGEEPSLRQGSEVSYIIRGFLPHALKFQTVVTVCQPFSRIEMRATGDLRGVGISTLEEQGNRTLATFQWQVELMPPVLRRLNQWRLFQRLFAWNHDSTMRHAIKNMKARVEHAHL